MTQRDAILPYQSPGPPVSKAAVAVFWLSIATALGFFLVIPAAVVCVAALVIRWRIGRRMDVGGGGLARAAVAVSASSVLLGMGTLILLPCSCGSRVLSNRSLCSANLRGIAQSMYVYAADNGDVYPVTTYAPYSAALNDAKGIAGGTTPNDVYARIYGSTPQQAGSPQACLWLLAVRGDVAPKQFICKSDPFAGGSASLLDLTNNYYDNFQKGNQLSYSVAYPWKADGTVGAWWKSTGDASLPLLADMAPRQGTGNPARNLTPPAAPSDPRTWNSGNHDGGGQNIAFADAHAEFQRGPNVGQNNDNIYSMSASPSTGPAQFGGIPADSAAPMLTAERPPFDTVMLPVRDETTGGM